MASIGEDVGRGGGGGGGWILEGTWLRVLCYDCMNLRLNKSKTI